MPAYKINQYGGLQYLTFPLLEETGAVKHAFSARTGGVSHGPYDSLNLGLHVGDEPARVLENRARLGRALGINHRELVSGAQVHGAGIRVVTESDRGRGAVADRDALPGVDALVTASPGVPLASYYADCVPVYILDAVTGVAALAHAGWKGTVLRIAQKTAEVMLSSFHCNPENCRAVIGPSIGRCCYRVDTRVIKQFRSSYPEWKQFAVPAGKEQWYLDLAGANKSALLDAGLKNEHVAAVELCTACRNDLFFSHRRSGGKTGRMASLVELK